MSENLFQKSSIWLALEKKDDREETDSVTLFDWVTPVPRPSRPYGEVLLKNDYQNWAPDQQSKTGKCVIMRKTNMPSGKMEWIKFSCDSMAEVVCEKKNTGNELTLPGTGLVDQKILVQQNDGYFILPYN